MCYSIGPLLARLPNKVRGWLGAIYERIILSIVPEFMVDLAILVPVFPVAEFFISDKEATAYYGPAFPCHAVALFILVYEYNGIIFPYLIAK